VPVKLRKPKRLRPSFDDETLDLFARLDRQRRPSREEEHDLARRLNLTDHYWTGNTPLNRWSGPCHPEGYIAHRHWFECRAVREQLLAALAARERA
jgi:hypothetical protein